MKCMLYFTTVLTLTIAMQSTVQGLEDLEGKIERVFLYQPRTDVGETYNLKARIEELGPKEKVMTVLLAMISLHRNARPGTSEYLYLLGSTWVLGEMGERQAVSQLSRNLFDQDVDKDIRGFTARSLGQIDPEGSKSLLLKA